MIGRSANDAFVRKRSKNIIFKSKRVWQYTRIRPAKEPETDTWKKTRKMNGQDRPNNRTDFIGSTNASSRSDWSTSRRMTCSHKMLGPGLNLAL